MSDGAPIAEANSTGSAGEGGTGDSEQPRKSGGLVPAPLDPDNNPERPLILVTTRGLFSAWVTSHVCFLLGGLGFGVYVFAANTDNTILSSLLAAAAMALAGSGAYYLRRIYKAGIQGRLRMVSRAEAQSRAPRILGTSLYILLRPLIAAALSVFVAMTVAATWSSLSPAGVAPTRGIIELASVYGFVVGFFSGRSLSQLESSGRISP